MKHYLVRSIVVFLVLLASHALRSQGNSFQRNNYQHVDYSMAIDFNAAANTFTGNQKAIYSNKSLDTLNQPRAESRGGG